MTETKRKGHTSENYGKYDHFHSEVSKKSRTQEGVSLMIYRKLSKYNTL